MKNDAERIEARLKNELISKLHDLLRDGKLRAWGRPESQRPQRLIQPNEWDEVELRFEERDLLSDPANVCAWRRVVDIRQRRISYVNVRFSSAELYSLFPLFDALDILIGLVVCCPRWASN
jgi:hypothetical protein